jgi:hypothetical protein
MAFMAPLAFGSAAAGGAAATAGLFGAGGAFGLGQTLATVGTAMGALGSIRQGQAASAAANYNAQMAERSAAQKEQLQRTAAQRQMGAIRAGIAKSGARTEGTPLMVLAESAANAEIDALNTKYSGQMESSLYRARGANDRRAAYWNAGTSLLTGASRIF